MGYMPDGNSAALAIYEHQQAQSSETWDTAAPAIIQEAVDTILSNEKWKGLTLNDFCQDFDGETLAMAWKARDWSLIGARVERDIRECLENEKDYLVWDEIGRA